MPLLLLLPRRLLPTAIFAPRSQSHASPIPAARLHRELVPWLLPRRLVLAPIMPRLLVGTLVPTRCWLCRPVSVVSQLILLMLMFAAAEHHGFVPRHAKLRCLLPGPAETGLPPHPAAVALLRSLRKRMAHHGWVPRGVEKDGKLHGLMRQWVSLRRGNKDRRLRRPVQHWSVMPVEIASKKMCGTPVRHPEAAPAVVGRETEHSQPSPVCTAAGVDKISSKIPSRPGGGHGKPFYVCLRRLLTEMEDRRATVTDALQSTTYKRPQRMRVYCGSMAVLLWSVLCAGVEVEVRWPRAGETIVASVSDGFTMSLMLKDIARTRQNCGELMLSVVEADGGEEVFAGSLCSCIRDEPQGHVIEWCIMNTLFDLASSAKPTLEITVTDAEGRERASTTVNYILIARNDTGLRQRIAELQKNYTAQLSHGRSSALGSRDDMNNMAMSDGIDELRWFSSLFRHEKRVFSQGGEDGVIAEVFRRFGTTNKFAVEFGAEDASEVNSRRLWEEEGWRAILFDSGFENTSLHPNASLFRHFITRENIIGILEERGALESPDFLSVDIDYNDFWVLDTILCAFAPRVIVAEVNRNWGPGDAYTVPYNASRWWTGNQVLGHPQKTVP